MPCTHLFIHMDWGKVEYENSHQLQWNLQTCHVQDCTSQILNKLKRRPFFIHFLLNFTKKVLRKSDGDDTGSNSSSGSLRVITDLPSALVFEIFHCLDVKDLGVLSCVSTLLNSLATNHFGWKKYYFERWGPPPTPSPDSEISWRELFVKRELRTNSFMGRFFLDVLHGHTEAVRAVFVLQSSKLIFTGGYDSVVRMWDLEDGYLVSASRPLGCTIRAIAADDGILIVGGTDAYIQCWRSIEGNPRNFDITGLVPNNNSEFRLWGHDGPITCLALDSQRIYSGSWDMSIRVWDRVSLKCLKKFRHGDWVWSLVPRGRTLASTAGCHVYIWDIDSEELVSFVSNAHVGNASALAKSYSGDLIFTGGEDGAIHMFDVSSCTKHYDIRKLASWKSHSGPVNSLAFEFPWLVSSSSDGRLSLINIRKLIQGYRSSKKSVQCSIEPPQRMLHGDVENLFSVAVGADRIVCGGDKGVVKVWNFSQALEIEKRAQALRGIRLENRMRRRKVQTEMNGKNGRLDQSMVAPKKNGIWVAKQRDRKS